MSEALSRLRLPLLVFSLLLLVGGSKLDSVRPLEGQVLAFAIPAITVFAGVEPFVHAHHRLRNVVFALGAVVLTLGELGAYRVVFDETVAGPELGIKVLLLLCMVLSVAFEVAAARRGLRSRLSAWLGTAIGFALYFPGHAVIKELFGSVFAAFMVSLLIFGALGVFLGELAVRRARAQ